MKITKEEIRIYNKVLYHLYRKEKNTERVRRYRAKKALQNKKVIHQGKNKVLDKKN